MKTAIIAVSSLALLVVSVILYLFFAAPDLEDSGPIARLMPMIKTLFMVVASGLIVNIIWHFFFFQEKAPAQQAPQSQTPSQSKSLTKNYILNNFFYGDVNAEQTSNGLMTDSHPEAAQQVSEEDQEAEPDPDPDPDTEPEPARSSPFQRHADTPTIIDFLISLVIVLIIIVLVYAFGLFLQSFGKN